MQDLARTLGPAKLVALVIAAAAPLSCLLGTVPLLFAFGTGAAAPFTFVASTVVLLLFSVGYAEISRHVTGGGALYTYVARGLGPAWGLGAAFVAVVAYLIFDLGCYAYTGYFIQIMVRDITGFDLSWVWWMALSGVTIGVLGYRQLDVSTRVIIVLLTFEFGLLFVFDAAILIHKGFAAFTPMIFDRSVVHGGSVSIGLMFAFLCYIGFESAAIYSEEVTAPTRSVPIALYAAVGTLGAFYIATTWLTIGLVGVANIRPLALQDPALLYFRLNTLVVGRVGTHLLEVFMTTSQLITTLALHNAATRYLFSLGRQRCFPARLGAVHTSHQSPHIASLATSVMTVVPALILGLAGVPPIVGLGSITTALGTIGILLLQALAAVAVVFYFLRRRTLHWWKTGVAPGLAALGLGAAACFAIHDFAFLSGTTLPGMSLLPWTPVVAFAVGFIFALWARRNHPYLHAQLSRP